MLQWIKNVVGTANDRYLRSIQPTVERVNALEEKLARFTDAQLQGKTAEFREKLDRGSSLDDILPSAFAVVREASKRVLGMRPYDCQLVGGYVLHTGAVAEMKTGEGKTLVATLPVYLHGLSGQGVHVVTVNDYLARRDSEWMGKIYQWLGLSTGVIVHDLSDTDRRAAYGSDITYGTNNEFGFDYLRDNMKFSLERRVQRPLNYAIVDEVDSILIDEARTPLIISGPADKSSDWYYRINAVVPFLKVEQDYLVDEKSHTVGLTDSGVDKVEGRLKLDNLYDADNIEILHHVHQALKAHALFKRDAQYVVEANKVIIVDEFTGRKMEGRRWSDGLHQAVEAKEGVRIEQENETLATITFQNFFRLYDRLSGMTGTADTEATELSEIYNLEVRVIPTNRPVIREDRNDLIYKTESEKWSAVADEIQEAHDIGQPVLVGTTSVEKSEYLASLLERRKITHSVLNAKFHQMEAQIVAQAGREGSVTIATNMAGRGTDIVLGGNIEALTESALGSGDLMKAASIRRKIEEDCTIERERVLLAGGLLIIGTERHESRRIDNQLRGRSGRQGDPGGSRFFLSLDDDLMRVFGGDRVKKMMETLGMPDGEPIEHPWINKSVENAQQKIEGRNYDIRKNVLEYDDVMNLQRKAVYGLRDDILTGTLVTEKIDEAIEGVVYRFTDQYLPEGVPLDEWDLSGLATALKNHFTVDVVVSDAAGCDFEVIKGQVSSQVVDFYQNRQEEIIDQLLRAADAQGADATRDTVLERWRFFERERYLRGVDSLWKHHLKVMESLRQGVHLEAYGQKDPKLVYKKQGYELFQLMFDKVEENVTEMLFRAEGPTEAEIQRMREQRLEDEQRLMLGRGSDGTGPAAKRRVVHEGGTYTRRLEKVGRNDPCPCGSGRKYKKCHAGREDELEMLLQQKHASGN